MKTLVPEYYEKFTCIGSACEDTCCAGWSIIIDKKTKAKYDAIPAGRLDLKAGITDNTFNLNHGNCAFLNEDKLCRIQLTLGEEYLTTTCATYPRLFNVVDGVREASATLSCPEIARLVLLNPEGIQNNYSEKDFPGPIENTYVTDDHFQNVRNLVLGVLQDRRYSVGDRMVILAMYFNDIEHYKGFEQDFFNEDFRGILADVKADPHRQFDVVKNILDLLKDESKENDRYKECYTVMAEYLGDSQERFSAAYEQYYKPFMQQHEYIMENYLINYAYRAVHFNESIEQFFLMCVYYAMIKFHLIGISGANKGLNEDIVVKTIQTFTRRYEHHPGTVMISQYRMEKGFTELYDFIVLLKN